LTVDLLLISTLNSLFGVAVGMLAALSPDLFGFFLILGQFAITMGYSIVTEWYLSGQTYGKRLCRIRVVDSHGFPLTFQQVLLRSILRVIDMLPAFYLVGMVSCMVTRKFQRLGDIAAGTIVISTTRSTFDPGTGVGFSKYNSLKALPHVVAYLRHTITPQKASVAMLALSRRDQLSSEARPAVFKEIADDFRGGRDLPQDLLADIPDEVFVTNVVEVFHTTRQTMGPKKQDAP
jgi:uncharacterized RDD family membrane protein YckC